MLRPLLETHLPEWMTALPLVIEVVSLAIELLATGIIVGVVVWATLGWALESAGVLKRGGSAYHAYKVRLGRGLLLGLEILVAADIIRTVALEPSLENVAILGLLVVIRTLLSWSLVVEIEGRWPWQARRPGDGEEAEAAGPAAPPAPGTGTQRGPSIVPGGDHDP